MGASATAGAESALRDGAEGQVQPEGVSYVSRQPILDRRGTVFGYQLRFQGFAGAKNTGELAPESRGILDALALFGIERFTAGTWGFVGCTAELFRGELLGGMSTQLTVLEIPRSAELSPPLLQSCKNLTEMGFKLALAGFGPDDPREALLPVIDYVKVDAGAIDSPGWSRLRSGLYGAKPIPIAEDIHSHAEYCQAKAAGLQYFQGYYFCHPELIPNGKLPTGHAHQFEILRELFKDPLDLKALCPLVSCDPSFVYRVLRFVNSPLCAVRSPITSIESAILILGDAMFRRMATLAIQCTLCQNQSPELLRMTVLRARFCAEAAAQCGLDPDEMYLLGMLSLLPAMLQAPIETILHGLPLRAEIRDALLGVQRKERCLLTWVEDLETSNIAGCESTAEAYGLDSRLLAEAYMKAMKPMTDFDVTQ